MILLILAPMPARADKTLDTVREALKRAESLHIDIPEQTNKDAEEAAQNASRYLSSKEFLHALERQKKRIQTFQSEPPNHPDPAHPLSDGDRLYIFISSSLPTDTLRAYVQDLNDLGEPNITLVLRGFVGGMKKVKPTLDFIEGLVKQDPACDGSEPCAYYRANIDIDPLAFRYFGIKRVPAVAFINNVRLVNGDDSIGAEGNIETRGTPRVYYGDMPLVHVLSELGKTHPKLNNLVDRLTQRGFYFER